MKTEERVHSDLAVPPGEYLEEVLEDLGMSKSELATRMGRPASKLSPIYRGDKAITPETALQFEEVLGVPAHIWIGLESEYRLVLARQRGTEQLRAEFHWVKEFCYAQLAKWGHVKRHTKPAEKVRALQGFFGVTSLTQIDSIRLYGAAFRRRVTKGSSSRALATWLRIGELEARKIDAAPHRATRLRQAVVSIRQMVGKSPDDFLPALRAELAQAGVALVLCPSLPKTSVTGATFWLGNGRAVVMMSNRGKWGDIFWFSLLHEIGHVLLHEKKSIFLETGDPDLTDGCQEQGADRFAADALIPSRRYERFVSQARFQGSDVEKFASDVGVHPGIVVGRLQNDGHLKHSWLNDLRVRYEWPGTEHN